MALWGNRDYRWWLVGDTGGAAATAIRQFAVPLLAYSLSGSTALAGVLGTVQMGLTTLATLPGGVVVDRYDRRRTIRLQALGGLVVWGTVAVLAASGTLTFGVLFALVGVGAVLAGLFGYATDAALRSLVGTEEYPTAVATNQGRDAAVLLAAGPVGAFLYAAAPALPFVAALVGHALTGAATWRIGTDLEPPARARRRAWEELAEAGRWLWGKRRLRWLVAVFAVENLGFAGFMTGAQFSLLARGYGAVELGWLATVAAAALLLGSVVAGRLAAHVPTGLLAIVGMIWSAACLVPAALWDDVPVLLASIGAAAVLLPSVNAALMGYLFGLTPSELQGRVEALLALTTQGLAAGGPVAAGTLLPSAGHTATLGLFVALLLAASLVAALARPLRSIPRPEHWKDAPL